MDLSPFPDAAPRRLLVGFSGGRDSTALLHRLATHPDPPWSAVRAIHVHHGLHADADRWARQCVTTAAQWGVTCVVDRVAVRRAGRGVEDAAREARYAAFAGARTDDECLVLAHHRDDQAETLLLALLRGSGERGLAAMRAFTVDGRGPIWRPLLDTPGAAVAAYAHREGLAWIEDPSNDDERLSRNHLRHTVMPLLRRQWPHADAALARSARHLADADALLREQAEKDLASLLGLRDDVLDAAALRRLPSERATRALRAWADAQGVRLTRDAIARVFGDWSRHPDGRVLRHALGDRLLRQWQGRLWLTPREPAADGGPDVATTVGWDGRSALVLAPSSADEAPGTLTLVNAAGFDAPLWLRPRQAAPARFHAAGDRHARSLQSHFSALGVPPWERGAVPLLVDGEGRLQALGDLAYGVAFDAWLRARGARLLWQPGEPRG